MEPDSPYLKSDASFQHCTRSIPCKIFVKPSVSTGAVSIINRERIRPKRGLRTEIEKLAGAYPRYGYRRITQLLLRQGYIVGTRCLARLMKENNLLVSVKRAGQTTKSLQREKPWSNLLENLEVSHQDQVWVADITYVRLKQRFIYVCLLMDVFTRVIKAWQAD